jgi:hypothetical protein
LPLTFFKRPLNPPPPLTALDRFETPGESSLLSLLQPFSSLLVYSLSLALSPPRTHTRTYTSASDLLDISPSPPPPPPAATSTPPPSPAPRPSNAKLYRRSQLPLSLRPPHLALLYPLAPSPRLGMVGSTLTMPPRSSLTSSFSVSDANNEVVCPLRNQDGSGCRKRCLGVSDSAPLVRCVLLLGSSLSTGSLPPINLSNRRW